MTKKVKKEDKPIVVQAEPAPGACGSMPTRPGSSKPGDWSCRDGKWVWVENIGG